MSDKTGMALVASNMAQLEMLMLESGEDLSPVVVSQLNLVTQNVDLCASVIERCELNAEFFRSKAKAFAAVAKAYEKSEAYLRQMIKDDMVAHGIDELPGTEIRFKLVNMKPKLVIDEANLDPAYFIPVPQPDKKKVQADLEVGLEVKGARLEEVKALRTYLNKKVES